MLEESIQKIRETESRAEEEKAAAKLKAQKLLTDAEKAGKETLAAANELLEQQKAQLLQEAKTRADAEAAVILKQAGEECGRLRTLAAAHTEQAVGRILEKGV